MLITIGQVRTLHNRMTRSERKELVKSEVVTFWVTMASAVWLELPAPFAYLNDLAVSAQTAA